MKVGSLFSGIGGFEFGFERAGFEVAWQVEIDPWCRKVLAKHWPSVPRYEDVREVGAHNLAPVDVIIGGFPCQDISSAGKGAGIDGARSGLWFEYARIVRELRPRYVVVENVAALLHRGLDRVLGELAACGYDAEWQCLQAASLGAPHRRERIFIVGNTDNYGQPATQERIGGAQGGDYHAAWAYQVGEPTGPGGKGPGYLAYPERQGLAFGQTCTQHRPVFPTEQRRLDSRGQGQWAVEPPVGRVANGVPRRVDRLRGLGNAVVPQVAQYVAECVMAHAKAQEAQAA